MSGKMYNGEKAIISLTSWEKRIDTCGLTIFSLLVMCPGYHIVLTLSEDEFPDKELNLPIDIQTLLYANKMEILWCKNNHKSFKKVIPTMRAYPGIPVISADDDCVYVCNYADILYRTWTKNKFSCITNNGMAEKFYGLAWGRGPNTLYPPCFGLRCLDYHTDILIDALIEHNYTEDDCFYGILAHKHKINYIDVKQNKFYVFHDMINPLSQRQCNFTAYINFLRRLI